MKKKNKKEKDLDAYTKAYIEAFKSVYGEAALKINNDVSDFKGLQDFLKSSRIPDYIIIETTFGEPSNLNKNKKVKK